MSIKTLPNYDPTLFEGAAGQYAQYRTKYPPAVYEKLAQIFNLNGRGRLLDLGCGPGLIAISLQNQFEEVVAVDPDPEMLKEAKLQAELADVKNITWLEQSAELIDSNLGTFKLVTIGRAFHWMDRELVLQRIYERLSDDGGIALLDTNENPWEGSHPWKQATIKVVKKWLGEQRRTGKRGEGAWNYPDPPHEKIIAKSAFARQVLYEVSYEQPWTISSYIGYSYTTAFALKIFFGDNTELFEADLKEALLKVEPSGQFTEIINASILVAWKRDLVF
jgi:ubiquinone/menaquinone biosynthesis C-methylase UbiE